MKEVKVNQLLLSAQRASDSRDHEVEALQKEHRRLRKRIWKEAEKVVRRKVCEPFMVTFVVRGLLKVPKIKYIRHALRLEDFINAHYVTADLSAEVRLYREIQPNQWPIVYSSNYDISFFGLEKVHPFDAGKWGKIIQNLIDRGMLTADSYVQPLEANSEDLSKVHTENYLKSLKRSYNVAVITEVCPVTCMPPFLVERKILRPFRYQTGGSILAAKLALERGWSINIGGGFHHCSSSRGGGFCVYADITLAIEFLFTHRGDTVKKAMVIDLDAHQGNGHERDLGSNKRVFILDVYNGNIYPLDVTAKKGIDRRVELGHFTEDREYLHKVRTNVRECLDEFQPDFVLYNAGTDILERDPLGCLSITPEGIIERDRIVFEEVRRDRGIPITMVTSGGYQRRTAGIIADSIWNLKDKGLIQEPPGLRGPNDRGSEASPQSVHIEEKHESPS